MGRSMCEYLHQRGRKFVVVDKDAEMLARAAADHGWLYITGDATNDDVLLAAGVERAVSLAAALHSDADNVYVVLSARILNPQMQIISRASDEAAVIKIQRAGADRVISPFSTAGIKMARMMLHPSVEDFLEIADDSGHGLELADVQISENSPYIGKSLSDSDLREKGVMIIGIRRANGERLMPPPGTAVLHAGDCLFAFGPAESVNDMISGAE